MDIQDIINSVDIVEYISQYIDLKEQNGEMFGLSPFREENTPSFSITPDTQLFYDFSSGIGGNVLTFIQKYHKCGVKSAINILKQYANITEDYIDTRLSATKTIKRFKPAKAQKSGGHHKILSPDVMSIYDANNDKLKIWESEGISQEIMNEYQVRYDIFSNRIVFPIRDMDGNIIAVKGRALDPNWKEKKMPKYIYFQEIGNVDFLFGYSRHKDAIREQKEIIIFEGEKSVMLAETWGIHNTVAILTSHLNPLQLPILIKLGARVVFALDKNINIKEDENIRKLSRFVNVEYIKDTENLIGEKDSPVDSGEDVWSKLYNNRRSFNN